MSEEQNQTNSSSEKKQIVNGEKASSSLVENQAPVTNSPSNQAGSESPIITQRKTEVPPALPGEDLNALIRKINALQSAMNEDEPSPMVSPATNLTNASAPKTVPSSAAPSSIAPKTISSAPSVSMDNFAKPSPTGIPPATRVEKRTDPMVKNGIPAAGTNPPPSNSLASNPLSPSIPASSIGNPTPVEISQVVKELKSIREQETVETYESRIADKPKTLIEEYGVAKLYHVQGEPLPYYQIPVARPTVSERAIINMLKEAATRLISITPYRIRDPEQKRNVYIQQILDILRSSPELKVPSSKYTFYAQAVVSEMVGYGLIDALIKDDLLEEIMVIGPNVPVFVFHRKHDMMLTNVEFTNDVEIQDLINRIAREVGRRVDISSPLLDARLADGSRVNATIPPASVSGSTLTIRKFRKDPYSIVDLVRYKTLTADAAAFLWLCADGLFTQPANILISGGTSSGKTTLLNVLCSFIPATERVISIEDTSELNLPLRHWIRLEGRPPGLEGKGEITLDILTKNSLRMRPDRIIVGEVRHDEAFSLFTAMNTGHDGSMGTIHANSAAETLIRVTSPPMSVPEVMLAGLNFIIVENLFHSASKGSFRRITEIAEVTGVIEGKAKTTAIFSWEPVKDELVRAPVPVKYLERLASLAGKNLSELEEDIHNRSVFLKGLVDKGVRDQKTVSQLAQDFLSGE